MLKPKTGSPGGGITSSVLTGGISLGTAYSKIARSAEARSLGEKLEGDATRTEIPGRPSRPAASAGVGVTNSIEIDLTAPAVAQATLSSAKPSAGVSSAR